MPQKEYKADLAVIGGSLGGFAAALAALRQGLSVIISEEGDRLGGQLTSQAVPPDEHPWIEQFGCTASYRRLRSDIRSYYRRFYPLTESARSQEALNPGNGFVSRLCHEPMVSSAVLDAYLRPYISGRQLTVLLHHAPVSAEVSHDRITAVELQSQDGKKVSVTAAHFIDATELGDLLPVCQAEHTVGAEARQETGEPHAADEADPLNQQSHSWCFAIDYDPGADHTIPKPAEYDFWRSYVPDLTPGWGGPLLSWQATHPITLEPVIRSFNPLHPQPERGPMDLWTFRRIADRSNFKPGAYASDIVLVNWPQIDYMLGPLVGVSPEEKAQNLRRSRELSLSMLYWMQTDAPREDGGTGWPGLRLRPDITGTDDGLAASPYIREARRIKGLFTVLEQHLSPECQPKNSTAAQSFPDSVGIGAYRIDLHPSTAGQNYIDVSALPFQIPLGALIPVRITNLLAGGKNLSATHITNGCYRLHPVEWNIGEAAGMLAAYCQQKQRTCHEVHSRPSLLEDFQKMLSAAGIELYWPQIGLL
ncbi:FAD-dependent oxidoreductase [bacterium]|nr:FAD-dependent oxidoreductase [bacterium]